LYLFICCSILFAGLNSSCRLQPNTLEPAEQDIADTLYNARIPSLRKELDSICQIDRDTQILRLVDSLVDVQLTEIRKLVERQ